eukprot:Seg2231.4 transcript_id=Seg2231.4/GoldUCD/mRNA.D3Y31 product="hypothetical protein" protein_id=Seg2231.4/GoldUCD/D3Y31
MASGQGSKTRSGTLFSTILGADDQKEAILTLSRAIKRSGSIVLENKQAVMKGKDKFNDPILQARALIDYINKDSATGIMLVSSPVLKRFFDKGEDAKLQINATDLKLHAETLKANLSETMREKIIIVTFAAQESSIPSFFQNCDSVVLNDSKPAEEISKLSVEKLLAALKRKSKQIEVSF